MILFALICLSGLGFSTLFPKEMPSLLKFLASSSIALLIFGQLNLLFAFFIQINMITIVLSALVTLILSFYLWRSSGGLVFKKINISPVFALTSILILGLSAYVFFNQVLAQKSYGLVTGGGGLYGDTALHSAYTSRLEVGRLPIENPLFAGKTLVYPFANDLLSALLRKASVNLNLSFTLPQLVFLLGFLSLLYAFSKKFMSDKGYFFSLMLLFFGWGVGWFFFMREWGQTSLPILNFLKNDFTNNDVYNLHFHNILTGLIWPERGFLPGIFLAMWSYINFLSYEETANKKYLLINGFILGSLPFWHTHTFIFITISWIVFGFYFLMKDGLRKMMPILGFAFGSAIILALPFVILFFSNHDAGNFIHCVSRVAESCSFGWQRGNENFLLFWFKNSFLIIPFALVGIFFLKKNSWYIFIPALVTFLIANFIIFQPWDWDNIKLLSLCFIFFSILAGIFIDKITKKNLSTLFLATLLIPLFTLSGVLSVVLQLKNTYVLYDNNDIELANWVKKNIGIDDVFLIDPIPNHPIPGLAGRLVYIGYPGHLWVHGIDYGKRENENNRILAGDFSQVDGLDVPISYVVMQKNKYLFKRNSNFQEVFQSLKYVVLKKTD